MTITILPPPVLALLCGALAWLLAQFSLLPMQFAFQAQLMWVNILAGLVLFAGAALAMLKVRTTINPLTPEKSSQLVNFGVFALTRNPIYLADALFLVAWALYLEQALAFVGPVLFVVLIRYQIKKEEQALLALFAEDYSHYCQRVRRWL